MGAASSADKDEEEEEEEEEEENDGKRKHSQRWIGSGYPLPRSKLTGLQEVSIEEEEEEEEEERTRVAFTRDSISNLSLAKYNDDEEEEEEENHSSKGKMLIRRRRRNNDEEKEEKVKRRNRPPKSINRQEMQIIVYTSGQPRAVATARELPTNIIIHPALNSLNAGACTGMTYEDMEQAMPEEFFQWKENPFTYRFPAGESQQDLVQKLQTLVMELEGHVRPVAVISHVSTLQVLYGYFLGHKFRPENYHTIRIPKNTVIELTPSHYGWQERRYDLSKLDPKAKEFPGVVYDHNTNFYSNAKARHDARAHD